VFENRALRTIFGPKRDEVIGYWRKLLNEELYNLYSSPNITRMIKSSMMRWAGHAASIRSRGMHRISVGKPAGKRPLGRPRRKWADNNKMDLKRDRMEWYELVDLAQGRDQWRTFVSTVMNLHVP
jgi:hypothetical protein